MITKKELIELADVIRNLNPSLCLSGHGPQVEDGREMQYEDTISALARFLGNNNPRFKKQRWLDYIAGKCGPNGGKLS